RRLFDNSMALFTGAIFTFTITLIYIFSIITNDSLMILSATAVTYGCVRLLTLPEFSARTALMTGLMAAVGVLTKANGLLFLPVMGLALLTLPVQSFRKLLIRALILLLIPTLATALWY